MDIRAQGLAKQKQIAIVASEFNEIIVERLLEGALRALEKHGIKRTSLTLVHVPGSFEIPITAQRLARTKKYDGIIALGCVIRGETTHFDYVAGQAASGILQTSLSNNLPVIFGVLTTESLEQAFERAGSKAGNKGYEAAQALIDLLSVFDQIDAS